jgi:hypothetical protein
MIFYILCEDLSNPEIFLRPTEFCSIEKAMIMMTSDFAGTFLWQNNFPLVTLKSESFPVSGNLVVLQFFENMKKHSWGAGAELFERVRDICLISLHEDTECERMGETSSRTLTSGKNRNNTKLKMRLFVFVRLFQNPVKKTTSSSKKIRMIIDSIKLSPNRHQNQPLNWHRQLNKNLFRGKKVVSTSKKIRMILNSNILFQYHS